MVCYKWKFDRRKEGILFCFLEDKVVNRKIYIDFSFI